jgi:hypothetical protein
MKMRNAFILLLTLILSSCGKNSVYLCLDDLGDREEYNSEIIIDCFDYKGQTVESIVLNGTELAMEKEIVLKNAGFYLLELHYKVNGVSLIDTSRFVILDPERGEAEWGLAKWIPKKVNSDEEFSNMTFIHPKIIPAGTIPLIAIAGDSILESKLYLEATIDLNPFAIKHGIGSFLLRNVTKQEIAGKVNEVPFTIQVDKFTASPYELSGELAGNVEIEENTIVSITGELMIPEGARLRILAGAYISISEKVNIVNNGTIEILGTQDNPVTFACASPEGYWGGIISKTAGNRLEATNSIFCQSGFHQGGEYDYGHAHRQALFYIENGSLFLDKCYMIDHAGQVVYPVNSLVSIRNCLFQRAITGGQINESQLEIQNTVFTDFPNDKEEYQDQDNDCLYISGSDADIDNCVFMYSKDDGLDSGGSAGGEITIKNSFFGSVFHEGAALSSGGNVVKNHTFINCTFQNCGQGIELGYSSPNHRVFVDSCRFIENGIGIRYGDNYTSPHNGSMSVKNSISINNYSEDIWNMLRENWSPDPEKITVENVRVSKKNPLYPELELYE